MAAARPLPRASEKTATADASVFETFRKTNARRFRGFDAPAANIACVVKATEVPYAEGAQFERQEFMKLMMGVQSAAQKPSRATCR